MTTTPPITATQPPRDSSDTLWIVLCHLSTLFGLAILFPLVVYLVKKDESATVAFHAREALNFHISAFIYALGCGLLTLFCIGIPMLICLCIAVAILSIVAAVRSADGQEYRYPLTIRFIQ